MLNEYSGWYNLQNKSWRVENLLCWHNYTYFLYVCAHQCRCVCVWWLFTNISRVQMCLLWLHAYTPSHTYTCMCVCVCVRAASQYWEEIGTAALVVTVLIRGHNSFAKTDRFPNTTRNPDVTEILAPSSICSTIFWKWAISFYMFKMKEILKLEYQFLQTSALTRKSS